MRHLRLRPSAALPRLAPPAHPLPLAAVLALTTFATLPVHPEPAPETFEIRGAKGLWWQGPAKYRALLDFLPSCHANFLMICYTSYPAAAADWRAGFSDADLAGLRDLVETGRARGIDVALAVNPAIWSAPRLTYSDPADAEALLRSFERLAGTGMRSFSICLDDIGQELGPEDARRYASLAEAQSDFVNRVWNGLRERKPERRLIFCPSAYTSETMRANPEYVRTIGRTIDPGVDFFWTGPVVWSPSITDADADEVAAWCGRKVVIWDNYPANDNWNWRPFLAPFRNRSATLPRHVKGYVANLMGQERASRIPLATLGEYFRDPARYDPAAALERALRRAAPPAPARAPGRRSFNEGDSGPDTSLRDLAGVYGRYFYDDPRFADPVDPATPDEAAALAKTLDHALRALASAPGLEPLHADLAPQIEADLAYLATMTRLPAGDGRQEVITLTGNDFAGGWGHEVERASLGPPKPVGEGGGPGPATARDGVNGVYATSSGYFQLVGCFHLREAPPGRCHIEVEGREIRRPGAPDRPGVEIAIEVNGQDAHRGVSGYPADNWGVRKFEIPKGALKAGKNRVTIWNIEGAGPAGGAPGFLVANARVSIR